MAHHWN